MKSKMKKYAGGNLVDSSGNPVRSSSGEPVRTRSEEEITADKSYARYLPKLKSMPIGKNRPSEDLVPPEPAAPSSEFAMQGGTKDLGNQESVKPIVDASRAPATPDDTYAYNKKYTITKPEKNPKSKVSKADLDKSGLSLRDYLNKERGLTRREPKFDKFEQTQLKSGGKVSSASSRGDGIAQRGKTKGRMC